MSKKRSLTFSLTPKQKKFAEYKMMGKSNAEAYRLSYNIQNMNPNTIKRKAYDVAHNPKVIQFIEEFEDIYKQKVVDEMRYGLDELLHDYFYMRDKARESIEENGIRQATANAYLGSLKEIGELLGLYPDKKLDVNANISSCDFEINITAQEEEIIESTLIEGNDDNTLLIENNDNDNDEE